ncbi:response regulator [Methanofollis aquaemaris]|uniref:Response regulator n=1 Tax=Methanofollis aquaemaris TaxID=126734 RepID=A0A8A3S3Z6_9EURY|nr:response regulator [Methanofollis aquaemaris]QSZ66792.1 response regulator [Methanofollis aquaemaris]
MKPEVLVIDDDRPILEMMKIVLERIGYRPLLAASADEGLALVRSARPELLLLDVTMAPVDGWQVLDALAADPDLPATPVMLFTARPLESAEYERHQGSIVEVLEKPIAPLELKKVLDHFFAG